MVEQSERQPRSPGTVQSVDRALDVLEVLARGEGPVGVGEIAAATGLAQGTAHRLLRSLQERGYVRHDASRKYSLGAAAFLLGDAARRSLARIARPHLTALVALSGETSNLAVLEGDDVVYLAQVPSPHTLRMFAEVGRHVPPHTITGLVALFDELDTTRARGWAADEEEQELGIRCVAVPVAREGRVVAALSLSGPAERFAGALVEGLVDRMAKVAGAFADELLGAVPPHA